MKATFARLASELRKIYCRLVLGLFEGEMETVIQALLSLPSRRMGQHRPTTQSTSSPTTTSLSRDVERNAKHFFHLFRDVEVTILSFYSFSLLSFYSFFPASRRRIFRSRRQENNKTSSRRISLPCSSCRIAATSCP